jgi:serine O-acetyltransferase
MSMNKSIYESEFSKLKEDIRIFNAKHSDQGLGRYLYYPDFRVVVIYRVSRWLYLKKISPLAYFLVALNDFFHGVWIGPNVQAGKGLSLGHPRGLVLNPGTTIGDYCTLLNQVTCGGPSVSIGNYVEIGVGAKLISNFNRRVQIGNHCIIGAGAVVTKSFPSGSVVAGVPAKIIHSKNYSEWMERHRYYPIDKLDIE